MSTRMLITKLVLRQDQRVDLYMRGHKFKDLTLFDVSDLFDVGLDPAEIQVGIETPCRFYAYYTESDKLNQAGNPYLDVDYLEVIDRGNGHHAPEGASVTNEAVLKELQAVNRNLVRLIALMEQGTQFPRVQPGSSEPADLPADLDTDEPPAASDGAPDPVPASDQGIGPQPLSDDQARRMFGSLVGPSIREGKVKAARVNEITKAASVIGWRDALEQLRQLIEG